MSIISVENLSKAYRVGKQQERADSLVGMLRDSVTAPFRNWRSFRQPTSTESKSRDGEDDIHWALRDVSFEVKEGEVLGVIGRNGAGKSTLLKILSRITEPTSGCVRIRGRVSSLLEVGTGFHPELSGRENVYLNGTILGMTKREINHKFEEIVEFSGVEKFLDTAVKRYSSGMKVRLAFAVAAHLEPEILIIDEVLAVGDIDFQKKCIGKMQDVASGGRTVLFVSHNMGAVAALCKSAVVLDCGDVAYCGNASCGIQYYLNFGGKVSDTIIFQSSNSTKGLDSNDFVVEKLEWLTPPPLRHGENAKFRLYINSSSPRNNISFAIGFCQPHGTRILTFDSDFEGIRFSIPSSNQFSLDFCLKDLPLAPGVYGIDVGVRSGDMAGLFYRENCSLIDVIPSERTPTYMTSYPGSGVRLNLAIENSGL